MSKVIALIGDKLGGKGAVADYLVSKYNAENMRGSMFLDEILNVLGLPISRVNETVLVQNLRKAFGIDVLAKASMARTKISKAPYSIWDGVRFPEEIPVARSAGATIIYVTAPADQRYERYLSRREKGDDAQLSLEQFVAEDSNPSKNEVHIAELGKQADFTIHNIGTLEELHAQVDQIISQIN